MSRVGLVAGGFAANMTPIDTGFLINSQFQYIGDTPWYAITVWVIPPATLNGCMTCRHIKRPAARTFRAKQEKASNLAAVLVRVITGIRTRTEFGKAFGRIQITPTIFIKRL